MLSSINHGVISDEYKKDIGREVGHTCSTSLGSR
jgi:hypothetical protein